MPPETPDDPREFGRQVATMTAQAIRAIPPGAFDVGERLVAINSQTERALRHAAAYRRLLGMSSDDADTWLSAAREGWNEGMRIETGFLAANHDAPRRAQ